MKRKYRLLAFKSLCTSSVFSFAYFLLLIIKKYKKFNNVDHKGFSLDVMYFVVLFIKGFVIN